jgi:hypothetical protein
MGERRRAMPPARWCWNKGVLGPFGWTCCFKVSGEDGFENNSCGSNEISEVLLEPLGQDEKSERRTV